MKFELLQSLSADELNQQELDRRETQNTSEEHIVSSLCSIINKKWEDAKQYKREIEKELLAMMCIKVK